MRRLLIPAVILVALCAVMLPAGAVERFPVGVRIALPATPTLRFEIEASGPAVLAVTAEARDLRRLALATTEAAVEATAIDGRVTCFIPVFSSGTVEVRIETSGGATPVLVTTSYGLGEVVRAPIPAPLPVATAAPEPVKPVVPAAAPEPAKPVATSAASVPSTPAAVSPTVPTPTQPAATPARTSPSPAPDAIAAPTPSPAAIAFPHALKMIFVGEEVRGRMTDGVTEGFRFYVPNRLGFTVTIEGADQARLAAEHGTFDASDLSSASPKRLAVSAPNEGHYRLALRGKGAYRIFVEAVR